MGVCGRHSPAGRCHGRRRRQRMRSGNGQSCDVVGQSPHVDHWQTGRKLFAAVRGRADPRMGTSKRLSASSRCPLEVGNFHAIRCRVLVAVAGGRSVPAGAQKWARIRGTGCSPSITPRSCTRSGAGCDSVRVRLGQGQPAPAAKRAGSVRVANGLAPGSWHPHRTAVARRPGGWQRPPAAGRPAARDAGGSCALPAARR